MTQDITGSDPPVPSDNLLRERVTMFLKSINRRQNTCVCIDSKCRLFTIIHCCSEHTICNLQDDDTSWLSLSYLRRDTHALSISNLRSRCSLRKQLHKSISNPITEERGIASRHYSSQMHPRTDSKCLLFPSSSPSSHFRYCAIFLSLR